MKTLRIAMIATLVAFALATFANADGWGTKPSKKIITLTFQQAIQMPELVTAMYQQLDEDLLLNNLPQYTFTVEYKNFTVKITGSFDQWNSFFKQKWYYAHNTFTAKPKE